MRTIEVKQLNYDLTGVAGLALVRDYLKTIEPVLKRVDKALPVRAGVANSDIVRSYVGLLVQGKSDFDAPRNYWLDKSYKQSLGIELLASSPTLRLVDAGRGALRSRHALRGTRPPRGFYVTCRKPTASSGPACCHG